MLFVPEDLFNTPHRTLQMYPTHRKLGAFFLHSGHGDLTSYKLKKTFPIIDLSVEKKNKQINK